MNKKLYLLAVLFFLLAVSANSQSEFGTPTVTGTTDAAAAASVANIPQGPSEHDMIVFKNGTMLDAELEEISPTAIKYRRVDNLTGPVFVVNSSDVYLVKYKNGSMDIINAAGKSPKSPILEPNKLYTGFSLEPSGFISGGPSATLEFSKGSIITSFHASFPSLALNSTGSGFGFGVGTSLSYYRGGPIGGFFMGGVLEWNITPFTANTHGKEISQNYILALQGGYKFILKNGIYFRTGIAAGLSISEKNSPGGGGTQKSYDFYYKPDIATGYIF